MLFVVGGIGSCEYRRNSLQLGYDALAIDDSKQKVIELMGPPSTAEPCFQTRNCTSFFYYAFLERWIIYVDSNDKVIDKVNNEGFF